MKEKRYTIEVTESQLRLIADCVEDCHRFAAGQMEMEHTTCMCDDMQYLHEDLQALQHWMTPKLRDGHYYPWDGGECPNDYQRKYIAQTYCIYREIIHRLRVFNRRKGDPYSVYDNPTLTCEEGGELPIIRRVWDTK